MLSMTDRAASELPPSASAGASAWVGRRIVFNSQIGTVRFFGALPGTPEGSTWLGVEWDDPAHGKHSGELQGVSYFHTATPGAGSFVKLSEKVLVGREFLDALREKYLAAQPEDGVITLGGNSKIEVETVGWDKIHKAISKLNELQEVGLSNCMIERRGQPKSILETCPAIQDLDLSRNLIGSWETVSEICEELPRLQSLRISHNRLSASSIDRLVVFPHLTTLALNWTAITWGEVTRLARNFPGLETLHLGFNQLQRLDGSSDEIAQLFPNLKLLNLESNKFTAWSDIKILDRLPRLESLFLNDNQIADIEAVSNPEHSFAALRSLNITQNSINSWMSLHHLNSYNLVEVRLKRNPILDDCPANDLHLTLIGRLLKVQSVNGSRMSPKERIEGEVFYLSRCVKNDSDLNEADFNAKHPTFAHLVSLHGHPGKPEASTMSAALKDNMVTLVLERPDTGKSVTKKVPNTMTIRALRTLAGRLLGLTQPSTNMAVVYQDTGKSLDMVDDIRDIGFYNLVDQDKIVFTL